MRKQELLKNRSVILWGILLLVWYWVGYWVDTPNTRKVLGGLEKCECSSYLEIRFAGLRERRPGALDREDQVTTAAGHVHKSLLEGTLGAGGSVRRHHPAYSSRSRAGGRLAR